MSTSREVPPDGAGASRTSMTVAAGRISTGAGPDASAGPVVEGEPMEARRRGYRQQEAAPPERGHPLTNLTRSMSQPASEPASAPALRHIPRRYLALGLIIVAICLLGALVLVRDNSGPSTTSTVETFSPAPSSLVSTMASVPASVYDAVGVSSPANPVQAPRPAGNGNAPLWLATVDGGPPLPVVFFYGAEFAPYAAVQRWPLILALSRFGTFNQLGLMQSSATHRVRQPVDLHLLERLVLEQVPDPRVRGALQLA